MMHTTQILKWFGCLAAISFGSFLIGRILPYRWFEPERFPYRSAAWERGGRVYVRIGLPRWQNRVPDMSRIFKGLMPAKRMSVPTSEGLETMIRETCIAEFIHASLAVLGFVSLCFWHSGAAVALTLVYSLGNIPFVLIQRYNRPRLMRLKAKLDARKTQV